MICHMQPVEQSERPLNARRRFLVLWAVIFCLTLVILMGLTRCFPSHSQFGAICETTAFDLNEARSDRLGVFLRKHLPQRVVQSPRFPSRFKDQPRYLQLGRRQCEWSIGGTNSGWLYFWGIDSNRGNMPGGWELAPCAETNLLKVTQVPAEFYGSTDPRRATVFGESSTNAIKVTVGQILFARRTDETNRIYILKLTEQNQNKLVVHYCVADQP
jgi:hypothetical protein